MKITLVSFLNSALHGEVTVGTKREWHGSLAGWPSVECEVANRKAGRKLAMLDETVAGCAKPAKAQA